jgi:hypothetical protein
LKFSPVSDQCAPVKEEEGVEECEEKLEQRQGNNNTSTNTKSPTGATTISNKSKARSKTSVNGSSSEARWIEKVVKLEKVPGIATVTVRKKRVVTDVQTGTEEGVTAAEVGGEGTDGEEVLRGKETNFPTPATDQLVESRATVGDYLPEDDNVAEGADVDGISNSMNGGNNDDDDIDDVDRSSLPEFVFYHDDTVEEGDTIEETSNGIANSNGVANVRDEENPAEELQNPEPMDRRQESLFEKREKEARRKRKMEAIRREEEDLLDRRRRKMLSTAGSNTNAARSRSCSSNSGVNRSRTDSDVNRNKKSINNRRRGRSASEDGGGDGGGDLRGDVAGGVGGPRSKKFPLSLSVNSGANVHVSIHSESSWGRAAADFLQSSMDSRRSLPVRGTKAGGLGARVTGRGGLGAKSNRSNAGNTNANGVRSNNNGSSHSNAIRTPSASRFASSKDTKTHLREGPLGDHLKRGIFPPAKSRTEKTRINNNSRSNKKTIADHRVLTEDLKQYFTKEANGLKSPNVSGRSEKNAQQKNAQRNSAKGGTTKGSGKGGASAKRMVAKRPAGGGNLVNARATPTKFNPRTRVGGNSGSVGRSNANSRTKNQRNPHATGNNPHSTGNDLRTGLLLDLSPTARQEATHTNVSADDNIKSEQAVWTVLSHIQQLEAGFERERMERKRVKTEERARAAAASLARKYDEEEGHARVCSPVNGFDGRNNEFGG